MFSCRELLFSTLFSCEQPQATESCEKGCFSTTSDATLGSFLRGFGLSSSSQSRSCFFSTLFYCEHPQATEAVEKCCFSRISEGHVRHFFGVVLELARPSEAMGFSCREVRCFPAGS